MKQKMQKQWRMLIKPNVGYFKKLTKLTNIYLD